MHQFQRFQPVVLRAVTNAQANIGLERAVLQRNRVGRRCGKQLVVSHDLGDNVIGLVRIGTGRQGAERHAVRIAAMQAGYAPFQKLEGARRSVLLQRIPHADRADPNGGAPERTDG